MNTKFCGKSKPKRGTLENIMTSLCQKRDIMHAKDVRIHCIHGVQSINLVADGLHSTNVLKARSKHRFKNLFKWRYFVQNAVVIWVTYLGKIITNMIQVQHP